MCGRFAIGQEPWSVFQERLNLIQPARNIEPSWNVKPTQPAPVVTLEAGQNHLSYMRWGYQFEVRGKRVPGFNARAEKVTQTWPYKYSVGKRHCLVPAIGFYEWTWPKGQRSPHFIHRADQQLFCMAGIWDKREIAGEEALCFSILTVAANEFMSPLHHRMPVILEEAQWSAWLEAQVLPDALTPIPGEQMAEFEVAPLKGDSADLVQPVGPTRETT